MHFTYEENLCETSLMQGDVLKRTPEIDNLLKEIHPRFYENPKNLFFMVLTQSCDLVQRKAPYITIVPVRHLDIVVQRHLAELDSTTVKANLPVLGEKSKTKATEFLQRLLNNNESGYFFLNSTDTELPADCVAFLNLSIALKADKHYESCLAAKILQLNDTFQAKLGWLVGQMYSRVGTPDWNKKELTTKIKEILKDSAIWVNDYHLKELNSGQYLINSDTDAKLTKTDINAAIKKNT